MYRQKISPIGRHKLILGIPWLKEENLLINWSKGEISYPPKDPETTIKVLAEGDPLEEYLQFPTVWNRLKKELLEEAKVASKEEADPNLEIPKAYQEYISVFEEEQFAKLPPHHPYNIDIELKEDHGLGPAPLYSMTLHESAELKQWIEKELASGKICPSKSLIASPVIFDQYMNNLCEYKLKPIKNVKTSNEIMLKLRNLITPEFD